MHGAAEPQLRVHLQRRERQVAAVQLAQQRDEEERRDEAAQQAALQGLRGEAERGAEGEGVPACRCVMEITCTQHS